MPATVASHLRATRETTSKLCSGPDCNEELTVYDPYDLVLDTDVLLDLSTLVEVENLVDEYTDKIDEALDAEFDDLEPPNGVSSDDLIDEARWRIEDAIDLVRSLAGCEDDL